MLDRTAPTHGTPHKAASGITLSRALLGGGMLFALAGCTGLGGPTYGTDKSVGSQLVEDLASVTTLRKERTVIDYKPRPGLVPPPEPGVLPEPQAKLSEQDRAWEQSPEALRKSLAADGSLRNVDTRSVASQTRDAREIDPATGKPVDMRKRAARIGPSTERRLLSDPPIEYRQPAATAPTGELGVSEYKKERIRAAAQGKDTGGFLKKLWPF